VKADGGEEGNSLADLDRDGIDSLVLQPGPDSADFGSFGPSCPYVERAGAGGKPGPADPVRLARAR
jgi:hypothetical protein